MTGLDAVHAVLAEIAARRGAAPAPARDEEPSPSELIHERALKRLHADRAEAGRQALAARRAAAAPPPGPGRHLRLVHTTTEGTP